ncbi:hypothetical protein HMPREF9205_2328 [Cutibacterium acnes SK182]|nr:hypothetical protein HMPREF9205_2328 [Cutibacterium acnes SK182]
MSEEDSTSSLAQLDHDDILRIALGDYLHDLTPFTDLIRLTDR